MSIFILLGKKIIIVPNFMIRKDFTFSLLVPKLTTGGAGGDFHFIRKKIIIVPNFVIRTDLTFSWLVPIVTASGAAVENEKIVANRQIRAHTQFDG